MVDVAHAPVAAILTRAPSAGGKSRLFAALRRAADPALLEALLLDTLDAVRHPAVRCVIAVEPAAGCDELRTLVPSDVDVMPQPPGSLGERMAGVMRELFARGAPAVVLVGSDLPDLPPQAIAGALDALASAPGALVLGPATDGGYYLLAAAHVPDVFAGIEWGTDRVLAQTLDAARRRGLEVRLLPAAGDVDTPDDLRRVTAGRTSRWRVAHLP
jgi:uncharacterized protein